MKLRDFRKTDIGNFFFSYIPFESRFNAEHEVNRSCEQLYESILERGVSFNEIITVIKNLNNNDLIKHFFADKRSPTQKETCIIRYVYMALLMGHVSKNANEIFNFFNDDSFKNLIGKKEKEKTNIKAYNSGFSRFFTDEVNINEIFLYNIIKNNKNIVFTNIKLKNLSDIFICNILSDTDISVDYKKWAISILDKKNMKNILDSYIGFDMEKRKKINLSGNVNIYTFNNIISYMEKPKYGINNKDYKKCIDFLFDENEGLIKSYPIKYNELIQIKNSESFAYFLYRTNLDTRTNKEKIIKGINSCKQKYIIDIITKNYKHLIKELFLSGNEWVLPYLNKKTENVLKKLPNEFKFECIKDIVQGNGSYFNKSYNSHNVNMFIDEFEFKENEKDSVFVDFKLLVPAIMQGNDSKTLNRLLNNKWIKKEDVAKEILKISQKRYCSTLNNNSDILANLLKETDKNFWFNIIKNSNIKDKENCTESNVYNYLFIYFLNNNKVFEYIELLPYISKIDDSIKKVIKEKIFEGMTKITNKRNINPLLILKKYGINYNEEDLVAVLKDCSPATTPVFLLNEVYYKKNKKIDYAIYINSLVDLFHNISYGNNVYKIEGFINALSIEKHECIDMLKKFNVDYKKDHSAYEKRKMKEKIILSILKDRLNVKFNEKTLFEKENLDVIITNLESDHIYDSFNNLKKSTKKRI
ncbi:TPA: hypothetical protein NV714_000157 [Escherichia coli]|nr:hypothetical protein [Escherichia coli]